MRIGEVIGKLTLSRAHPALVGGALRIVVPLRLSDLAGTTVPDAEPIVVYDVLAPGQGSRIAISEGPEASNPFYPEVKPIDAYSAALLDRVQVQSLPAR